MSETRLNLTRRFRTASESREEAETNLCTGSVWVPYDGEGERPALLLPVSVSLVLPDGGVLEALPGRVSCVAPSGFAVVLDDLPSAFVLARLLGGDIARPVDTSALAPVDSPPLPVEDPFGDAAGLAPEDAPPLPAGLLDSWQPIVAPPVMEEVSPAPELAAPPEPAAPVVIAEPPPAPVEEAPVEDPASVSVPAPSAVDAWAEPPSFDSSPASVAPESLPTPLETQTPTDPPAWDGADFPASRDTPVPAVPSAGMWGDGGLGPDADLEPSEPGIEEPGESRPVFSVQFATGAELEAAWAGGLGAGRVLVTVEGEPPPLDARVDVTLGLPEAGTLMLEATVVHRTTGGAGLRLHLDEAMRAVIEFALRSKAGAAAPPPAPPVPDPLPVQTAPAPEPPQLRPPTLELRKSASGKAEVVLAFETLADFRREYETNIRKGGVMVPTAERPPVRSVVEVVFSLLGGKREVRLNGEVVLHSPSGIGLQLSDIPQNTRVEIDSLLAAAGPKPEAATPPRRPTLVPEPPSVMVPAVPSPTPAQPFASSVPDPGPRAPAERTVFAPSGSRFEGELAEVMREAEVEGEAGSGTALGTKASWLKVLAHLQVTRSNGVLYAIRKAETKSFVIHQGRVLDAKGDPSRDDETMLRVIRKHSLAKPGVQRVLERALDKVPDELQALQSANVWSAAEIDRARRWQVLERASEVFAWEKGQFKFDPEGDRSWMRPSPGVPVGHVILHGVRSFIRASGEDMARILRPGFDRALTVVPNTGFEPARVGMADKELKFWAEIDGEKTLRQLLATSPIGQSQSHRLIFALCRLGVLAMEKAAAGSARPKDSERAEALKARAIDMKSRDVFGRLGISWMCAAPHVQIAWDTIRRELDPDVRTPGPTAEAAKAVLAVAEDAWRQLVDDRTRRLQRLKLIEDPARIEAAADMLAERANLLRMQGDIPGAESALAMALDMAPGNPAFLQLLARVKAG